MHAAARAAGPDDLDAITSALADAFSHDPVMTWAHPGELTERRAWLANMFGYLAEHRYIPLGQSVVTSGSASDGSATARGGALWLPVGSDDSDESFWRTHGEAFMAAIGGPNSRLIELSEAMDTNHPSEPHRYLLAIGVETSGQGSGLGSQMMKFSFAELDAAGEDAYLEATSVRSRALYERLGFETMGEFSAADSPPLWPMWRAARTSA